MPEKSILPSTDAIIAQYDIREIMDYNQKLQSLVRLNNLEREMQEMRERKLNELKLREEKK